jgi:hypothetical protein
MPEIPNTAWVQYPALLIFLVVIFALLREFKTFIKERDIEWRNVIEKRDSFVDRRDERMQLFLAEQRNEYIKVLEKLTVTLQDHDIKTDRAITRMEERTRPIPRKEADKGA